MVKRLFVAAAWAAAARRPICMLSLDNTDEGITVCGRLARRIPISSWLLSFLKDAEYPSVTKKSKQLPLICIITCRNLQQKNGMASSHQIKSTESPATSLFALTNTLHPVVRRCLFGWPASPVLLENIFKNYNLFLRVTTYYLFISGKCPIWQKQCWTGKEAQKVHFGCWTGFLKMKL